jgi:hypothetical protein
VYPSADGWGIFFCKYFYKSVAYPIMFIIFAYTKTTNKMKNLTTTITASEIRSLNIQKNDCLSFSYCWENGQDNHYLHVNGNKVASFSTSREQLKSYNKIRKMDLGWGWKAPQLTDEEQGIIEAAKNGENPFAYSIICADPSQNGIFN